MDLTPAYQLAASRLFLTKEDVDDIAKLISMCKKEQPLVVDLGAGTGNTALTVFLANPKAKVCTIDISAENIEWAKLNLESFGIDISNWFGVEMDASEAADNFLDEQVDILLHDADHSEEMVSKNLEAWRDKLVKGAYVWIHDYLPMSNAPEYYYPGVKNVCDKFAEQKHVRKIKTKGIGFAVKVQ